MLSPALVEVVFFSEIFPIERLPGHIDFLGRFSGPDGPLLPEMVDMYLNSTVFRRGGEISTWDNTDIRAAVEETDNCWRYYYRCKLPRETGQSVILNAQITVGLHHVRLSLTA